MHETAADLAALQRLLDATGAHLASIFTPDRRASASEVAQLLRCVCVLALGTVGRDGAPLVAPVDGLFFRGRFTFSSSPQSVRVRHIRRDARVSANYNREVYGESWDSWGTWGKAPYAVIEPRRMFAALMNRAILEA